MSTSSRIAKPRRNLPQWPPPKPAESDSAGPPPPIPLPRSSKSPPTSTSSASSTLERERPPLPLPEPVMPAPRLPSSPLGSKAPVPHPRGSQPSTATEDVDTFGSCLQTSQDVINKRHEDDLRALESFRVHIFNRAKADKDYAEALAKANMRASKGIAGLGQGSTIVQVRL